MYRRELLLIIQNKQSLFTPIRTATSEGRINYDPIRFCFECQKLKPTKGFRPLSRTSRNPRVVCAECFDKVEAIRKERRAQAINSTRRDLI